MSGLCGDCAHWLYKSHRRQMSAYGWCRLITHLPHTEEPDDAMAYPRAYFMPGAALMTRATFGCNQHKLSQEADN